MNYPSYIYRDFTIIEKDLYGEKHYAVVERKSFLLFSWTRKVRLYGTSEGRGWESSMGEVWHNKKRVCLTAIEDMNQKSEWRFERAVRR